MTKNKTAIIEQRNKFSEGDLLECFGPKGSHFEIAAENMQDENGNKIDSAPHAQQIVRMEIDEEIEPNFILRKKVEE